MENQTKNFRCIIIEDEPIAAEVLKDYIEQVNYLGIEGVFSDALFALDYLRNNHVDLIFLDINLPKLKGLDFIKVLTNKPKIILTTAYHEHAIDAFELGVVDYLLKPIEFSRFLIAVNKLNVKESNIEIEKMESKYHFFNVNKKMVKVNFDDILYIESIKDYSRIFFLDQNIITHLSLANMESILMPPQFRRIHKSYIINTSCIHSYTSTEIEIRKISLPIGRAYLHDVQKWLHY
jgi:DNA-binding LytR/AlgR family response regulator